MNSVSKKTKLQNPRRQVTKQKKRENVLRRQRISNRKTATKLRKIEVVDNPVIVTKDRPITKSNTQPVEKVGTSKYLQP